MYEAYYGFTEKPFNLTPDPKYLYQSRRHTEAVGPPRVSAGANAEASS